MLAELCSVEIQASLEGEDEPTVEAPKVTVEAADFV